MTEIWNKIDVICRVCLEEKSEMFSIFENIELLRNTKTVYNMIMECTSVKVYEGDGLPTLLCQHCLSRLETAYFFKQECERSDNTLRRYIDTKLIDAKKLLFPNKEEEIMSPQHEQANTLDPISTEPINVNTLVKIEMAVSDNEDYSNNDQPNDSMFNELHDRNPLITEEKSNKINKYIRKSTKKRVKKKKQTRSAKNVTSSVTSNVQKIEEYSKLLCYVCCKDFNTENEFEEHKILHPIQRYVCEIENCDRQFEEYMEWATHRKNDHLIKEYLKCLQCEDSFFSQKLLDWHIIIRHPSDKPFSCQICTEPFNDAATLNEHVKLHSENKCHICEKIFTSRRKLSNHLKLHSEEKSHICEECGRSFLQKYKLKQHIDFVHKGIKPPPRERNHLCSLCGQTFVRPVDLNAHVRKHIGSKPFTCDKCDYRCHNKQLLKSHVKKHLGQRPHKCSYCGKCFSFRSYLTVHERIHSGERPYTCSQCNKGFTNSGDLKVHARTHTGVKLFKCDICGNSFTTLHYLKVHKKKHDE